MTTTRKIAKFVTELRYEDLPNDVVEMAKAITLNSFAIQLAASTLPWSKIAYRFGRSQGGAPQSTVVNYGMRTTASNAAFMNSCFNHAFEMDDYHGRTGIKGGCVTVPPAMAVGELELSSGRDFITALVAGYEVMCRTGLATHDALRRRALHPTGHAGAIGSAVIAGKLMRLDETTMMHTLGSAATNMIGLENLAITTGNKGYLKRTYGGQGSVGGIRAALMAREGMVTAETTLDAEGGYSRAFDIDVEGIDSLTAGLGRVWEIMTVQFKIWAQDGHIQPATECLEKICKENSFSIDDIEQVVLGTHKRAHDEVIGPVRQPNDLTDAQFSAAFSIALYLVKRAAGFAEYNEENLRDPVILELAKRVVVEIDDELEAEWQRIHPRSAKVTIRMKSGEELQATVHNLRAMSKDDLDEKFRGLAPVVLDHNQSERLLTTVRSLEDVRDVSTMAPLLVR